MSSFWSRRKAAQPNADIRYSRVFLLFVFFIGGFLFFGMPMLDMILDYWFG